MSSTVTFPGAIVVKGDARINGDIVPAKTKSSILAVQELAAFTVPMTAWRTHDAYQTALPAAPLPDDLGLVGGTHGTNAPSLQTLDEGGDAENIYYARAEIPIPAEYVAGQTIKLRFHAGMLTTIADQLCTLDVEVYKSDEDGTSTGDLYAGAALDMNSITFADIDFDITPATLSPGDLLDVKLTLVNDDDGDGGAGITGVIGSVQLLCDIR